MIIMIIENEGEREEKKRTKGRIKWGGEKKGMKNRTFRVFK